MLPPVHDDLLPSPAEAELLAASGVTLLRRTVLWLPAALFGVALLPAGAKRERLDLAHFVAAALPFAKALLAAEAPDEEDYLHQIAALASRLAPLGEATWRESGR